MVVNGNTLFEAQPIKDMLCKKIKFQEVSHGMSEAGYDIRIKQSICFKPCGNTIQRYNSKFVVEETTWGRFILASTMDQFDMPTDLVGIVHDKSSWARKGLSVFNTVIEPGWKGFLTLELVYHGNDTLFIPAGSGIAQVIFHKCENQANYDGKYQFQQNMVVKAIAS